VKHESALQQEVQSVRVACRFSQRLQNPELVGAPRAGIVTSLLVSLLGQARIYVVLGREQLLPSWFARIHPTRDTPMRSAIFTGCTAGARAPGVCVVILT
jgi:hypothetical protein